MRKPSTSLFDLLNDVDDVQNIYHNAELPEQPEVDDAFSVPPVYAPVAPVR